MAENKLKSPLERWMKKSYEEMSAQELLKIRIASSLFFSVATTLGIAIWDKLDHTLKPLGAYIFGCIIGYIGWYYLFWFIFSKIKKINLKK